MTVSACGRRGGFRSGNARRKTSRERTNVEGARGTAEAPKNAALLRYAVAMDARESTEFDALVTLCYPELRGLAQRLLAGERRGHTLQATALVNEAWLRLRRDLPLVDRDRCMGVLAYSMRRLLIDHARARNSQKRGGTWTRQPLDDLVAVALTEFGGWEKLEALEAAMTELERTDPQLVRIIEAKVYAELTDVQAATCVGIGVTTLKKRWTFARAWLHGKLSEGP